MDFGAQRRQNLFTRLDEGRKKNEPLEAIVEVDGRRRESVARELDRIGEVIHVFGHIPYIAAIFEPGDAEQIANEVYGNSVSPFFRRMFAGSLEGIRDIDATATFRAIPLPDAKNERVQGQSELWNLRNIGAYEAMRDATGKGVKIGIIDSGVDYTHPELHGRFGSGRGVDFVDGRDPMDQNGHGTHVAGTVAGRNVGIARDCSLYAIRVLDEDGSGSEISVMQGIEWALDNGVDVVNMSLGSGYATRAFEELCDAAYGEGMLLAAAAGNDGGRYRSYPAAFGESVIAVAAVDQGNEHAPFSNVWKTNDISAPGVNIYSSFPGGRYRKFDGTSMATPHVTGTLALGISVARSTEGMEDVLARTAQELGAGMARDARLETYGAGLARADALVHSLMRERERYATHGLGGVLARVMGR